MAKCIYLDSPELLCKKIRQDSELDFIQEKERFEKLFENIAFPITLVVEEYYSDRDYKDSYYQFFASKYRHYSRYAHRVVIFEGEVKECELYDKNFDLESRLVGVITIRPLKAGCIGKTLFNPKKLKLNKVLIRSTDFELGLFGRKVRINSFPFSSQDGEYMTCAETALWAILQYYGTRYKEYKVALPHDIVGIVDNESFDRVTPSRGLHYWHTSKVLKKFDFSPRIYNVENENDKNFERYLHYYVESGIPLMVGININFVDKQVGHLVLCIGREKQKLSQVIKCEECGKFQIVNSANFTQKYVFMDDNKFPFTCNALDDFQYKEKKTEIKYFIVPLYKRIFLTAEEAERVFYQILTDEILGLKNISLTPTPIIIRIFLATSRNYKAHKFSALGKSYKVLDRIPLPKFVWVCEISTEEQYRRGKVCGEIVLDATAAKCDDLDSILLLRYPKRFARKLNGETMKDLKQKLQKNASRLEEEFDSFNLNLKEVGNE